MTRPRPCTARTARAAARLAAHLATWLALTSAAVAGVSAQAQPADAQATALSPDPEKARADREFVDRSLQAGLGEVALGRLAQARAAAPSVQALAAGLAQEQAPVNDELARLGSARGLPAAAGLDRYQRDMVERLGKLQGADFDRAYLKQMADSHRLAVTDFERQANQTQDAQLKDFCVRALPVLRTHLRLATAQQEAAQVAP
ncbi:MAG: DUF4142 domain-containing protein [Burkholderiaceae bacterium]